MGYFPFEAYHCNNCGLKQDAHAQHCYNVGICGIIIPRFWPGLLSAFPAAELAVTLLLNGRLVHEYDVSEAGLYFTWVLPSEMKPLGLEAYHCNNCGLRFGKVTKQDANVQQHYRVGMHDIIIISYMPTLYNYNISRMPTLYFTSVFACTALRTSCSRTGSDSLTEAAWPCLLR